jgi:uncharacterized protein (DUF433 family)
MPTKEPDIRELPAYGVLEAAHYLRIPGTTVRAWFVGTSYGDSQHRRRFHPVIEPATKSPTILSFINLVEAHVLDAIRRQHHVELPKVRNAVYYLKRHLGSQHPLVEHRFETDGIDLFVEKYGQLISVSQDGQLAVKDLLKAHLRRIEWDTSGLPIRLYPFTRKRDLDEPKNIVIDPFISFGRPIIAGTGVVTEVVAERFKAGESADELADDYGCERLKIEEAIRCELSLEAA